MISQSEIRKVLENTLVKNLESIFGENIDIYFLGLNKVTQMFHWLALNDDKQQILLKQIPEAENIWDPNNPLEIPCKPVGGKILLAIANEQKRVIYTPNARIDPRSFEPSIYDEQLGLCSVLYIPLSFIGISGEVLISNPHPNGLLLHAKDEKIKKMSSQSYLTDPDELLKFSQQISLELEKTIVKRIKEMQPVFSLLWSLFETYIENYRVYMGNFDTYIIQRVGTMTLGGTLLGDTIKKIQNLEESPHELIRRFLSEKSPAAQLLECLYSIEPFLFEAGYRGHFNHMFHVFLIGSILLNEKSIRDVCKEALTRDFELLQKMIGKDHGPSINDDLVINLWFLISTSHDVAYPVQCTKDWLAKFFENYFPSTELEIFVGQQPYFSHCNFSKYKNSLISFLLEKVQYNSNPYLLRSLLTDLWDWNLCKKVDHAIVSSLITMDILERMDFYKEKQIIKQKVLEHVKAFKQNEMIGIVAGASILLHNFHQWKLWSFHEPEKGKREESAEIEARLKKYKIGISTDEINNLSKTFSDLQIRFTDLPFAFLLAVCDTLQECDRLMPYHIDKRIIISSIRTEKGKVNIALDVPVPLENAEERKDYKSDVLKKIEELQSLGGGFSGEEGWQFFFDLPTDLSKKLTGVCI